MKPATMTLQEQIDELRLIGESRAVTLLAPGGIALAIAGFSSAAWVDNQNLRVLCLFVAACSSLVALGSVFGIGHVRNAALATRKGRREPAMLVLHYDPHDDEPPRGVLTPTSRHAHAWDMVLVQCRGWRPPPGAMQVDAIYLSGIAWPVLLVHADGILWPRARPRPLGKTR